MLAIKECPSCEDKFRPFYMEQIYCDDCRVESVFQGNEEDDVESHQIAYECVGCGNYRGSETANVVKQEVCGKCEYHEIKEG